MKIEEEKKEKSSIQPSRVVPHRSTAWTRPSLTSLFRWEAVTLSDVAEYEEEGGVAYMYIVLNKTFPPPTFTAHQCTNALLVMGAD